MICINFNICTSHIFTLAFHLLLLASFFCQASVHHVRHRESSLGFPAFLAEFRLCCVSYMFWFKGTVEEGAEINRDLRCIREKFSHLALQMVTVNDKTLSENDTMLMRGIPRLSKCSLMALGKGTVKLPKSLLASQKDFVAYVFSTTMLTNPEEPLNFDNPTAYWQDLNYIVECARSPAVYLKIHNYSSVFAICIPCLPINQNLHFPIKYSQVDLAEQDLTRYIRKKWFLLNSNLQSEGVMTPIQGDFVEHLYDNGQQTPCTRYPRRTSTIYHTECAIALFRQIHNITSPRPTSLEALYRRSAFPAKITKHTISEFSQYNIIPTHYDIDVQPWAYLMVIDKYYFHVTLSTQANLRHILQPFVWWTWLSLVTFSLVISFAIILSENEISWRSIKNVEIFRVMLELYATLLEESATSIRSICRKASFRQLCLFSFWCGLCLILAESYKSFLFTTLSVSDEPVAPETLEDLIESRVPIITTMTTQQNFKSELISVIVSEIITGKTNDARTRLLKKLSESARWWPPHRPGLVLEVVQNGKLVPQNYKITKVSEHFAILDPIEMVHEYQELFTVVGSKLITRPVLHNIFVSRMSWFVTHNYMFKIFTSFIAQLSESGQIDRWNKYYWSEMMKEKSGNLKFDLKHMAIIDEFRASAEHVIPKDVFVNILIHFGICVAADVLTFLAEILHHGWRYGNIDFLQSIIQNDVLRKLSFILSH